MGREGLRGGGGGGGGGIFSGLDWTDSFARKRGMQAK